MANNLKPLIRTGLSIFLRMIDADPFKTVTVKEFLSGYDDTLTSLANSYFPKGKRPPRQMGLFLSVRNAYFTKVAKQEVKIANKYSLSVNVLKGLSNVHAMTDGMGWVELKFTSSEDKR